VSVIDAMDIGHGGRGDVKSYKGIPMMLDCIRYSQKSSLLLVAVDLGSAFETF
jgi:hypothetical protein